MISDLCERDDHGACFDDELDGCRCACHPTDCLAGIGRTTTQQPSTGGARQAAPPKRADGNGPTPTVRAACGTLAPGSAGRAVPPSPVGGAAHLSSPQPSERQAAGIPGPETAPPPPLGTGAVRVRVKTPAPAKRTVRLDRAPVPGRAPDNIPARGGRRRAAGAPRAGTSPIAAAMSEAELEVHVRAILKGAAAIGPGMLLGYHTHDSRASHPGYPDWTFAGPGGVLFRELKTARGRLTAAQQDWQRTLRRAGTDVDVWRPEDLLSGRIARELAALAGLRAGAA